MVSFMGFPFLHRIARLSPTLATTSSIPSLNRATVAVVPDVRKVAVNIMKKSTSYCKSNDWIQNSHYKIKHRHVKLMLKCVILI